MKKNAANSLTVCDRDVDRATVHNQDDCKSYHNLGSARLKEDKKDGGFNRFGGAKSNMLRSLFDFHPQLHEQSPPARTKNIEFLHIVLSRDSS